MNNPLNMTNGAGLLKSTYAQGGPVSQMNKAHPMIHSIRKRRDALKK